MMNFDWTVSVASAIQFVLLMAGLLSGLWRWSTRMTVLDVKLDYMQKELSRLTDVASKQVAHDERLRSIEQRIENLRCFEQFLRRSTAIHDVSEDLHFQRF